MSSDSNKVVLLKITRSSLNFPYNLTVAINGNFEYSASFIKNETFEVTCSSGQKVASGYYVQGAHLKDPSYFNIKLLKDNSFALFLQKPLTSTWNLKTATVNLWMNSDYRAQQICEGQIILELVSKGFWQPPDFRARIKNNNWLPENDVPLVCAMYVIFVLRYKWSA
jgi:hypothetical protein